MLLFQRVDDDAFTAFGEDSRGNIAFAFNPIWPKIGAFERIPWYETIWVQLGIAGFCAIVFLSACIMWSIRPLIRRLRGKPSQKKEFSNALADRPWRALCDRQSKELPKNRHQC